MSGANFDLLDARLVAATSHYCTSASPRSTNQTSLSWQGPSMVALGWYPWNGVVFMMFSGSLHHPWSHRCSPLFVSSFGPCSETQTLLNMSPVWNSSVFAPAELLFWILSCGGLLDVVLVDSAGSVWFWFWLRQQQQQCESQRAYSTGQHVTVTAWRKACLLWPKRVGHCTWIWLEANQPEIRHKIAAANIKVGITATAFVNVNPIIRGILVRAVLLYGPHSLDFFSTALLVFGIRFTNASLTNHDFRFLGLEG